jgi:polar amino acid transport system permease protein
MTKVTPFFIEAAIVTVQLSILSIALGLILGALGAAGRLSDVLAFRMIATTYVSVIRGTPALIQLFILYFGGPQVGINLDPFAAGAIGLGINIGAYMAETMRGAIVAINRGQAEAARTLGLSKFQAFYKVVFPQAARLMIRPLGVNINAQIKATALVSAISVVELTYTAQRYIGSTYRPFEMFALAGILYMIIIYVAGRGVTYLDKKAVIQ